MNVPHADFRKYIAIVGRRNAGKSSLINIAGQDVAIVSDISGATTYLVYETLKIHPLGPVTFIDAPELDDEELLVDLDKKDAYIDFRAPIVEISAKTRQNVDALLHALASVVPDEESRPMLTHLIGQY